MSAVKMLFCGDALPDVLDNESDPFFGAADVIADADLRFINLEACIASDPAPFLAVNKKNVLWTGLLVAPFLKRYGFQVVNIANNHVFDLGLDGCLFTIRELRKHSLGTLGLREGRRGVPIIVECNGLRLGFLGYADYGFKSILTPLRRRMAATDVKRLRKLVDIVVVSLHWGYEYVSYPSPRQRLVARTLVEAGADIIVGGHPHISQGIESYRGAVICYSLGNFFFSLDEMPLYASRDAHDILYGFLLSVTVDHSGVRGFEAIPVSAYGRVEVEVLSDTARARSLSRLNDLSAELDRHTRGFVPWIWDASRAYALLFRSAWAYKIKEFGPAQVLKLAIQLAQDPILLALLIVSFLRFPQRSSAITK